MPDLASQLAELIPCFRPWPHRDSAVDFYRLAAVATAVLPLLCCVACDLVHPLTTCGYPFSGPSAPPSPLPHDGGPLFKALAIPTDSGRFPYNHASTVLALPDGTLLVAWGAGSRELGQDTVILGSRLAPQAVAWTPPEIWADRPGFADANPVLFIGADGRLRLLHVEMFGDTFCLGRVVQQTTDNVGVTWSSPVVAIDAACVMVRNRPIQTRSGRWILPAYTQAVYQSQFFLSDHGGESWVATPPLLTFPNNLQPAVVETADGSLLALLRTDGDGCSTWEARSSDGGQSWTMCLRKGIRNPNSGLDLLRLLDGRLVFAYNDSERDRYPLVVCLSDDDGQTWTRPRVVDPGPHAAAYPSLHQAPDGAIHLTYSHDLQFIQHVTINAAWILATEDAAAKDGA